MTKIEYNGGVIEISVDPEPENPRVGFSNISTMVCWHRRYDLGDKTNFRDHNEFSSWWKKNGKGGIISKLWLLDHSGLVIRSGDRNPFDPWDSGLVGFVYATASDLRKKMGLGRLTAARRKEAMEYMESEVELYNSYLGGDVYRYTTYYKGVGGKLVEIDSCGGYYGYDFERSGILAAARDTINLYVEKIHEQAKIPRNFRK